MNSQAFASMLGFDTSQLQKVKGEQRVRDFWLMLSIFPSTIIFLDGQKLSIHGFRWAPKAMMLPTGTRMDPDSAALKCHCTAEGLYGIFLYVRLVRALQGSNRKHDQTLYERTLVGGNLQPHASFLIWIDGDKDADRTEDRGVALRVHCNEQWPAPPETLSFDGIVLLTTDNVEPSPGEWCPGVALFCDGSTSLGSDNPVEEAELVCSYVGRAFVERLRMEELLHPTPTIMYTGADYTVIDVRGAWKVMELRIT